MNNVQLRRIDSARNMARYYTMSVQPTLFGEWSLVREWGRINCGGQLRATPYPTPAEALVALQKIRTAKERRGYSAAP